MLNKLFGSPKNHPFNQAREHYRNLCYYESGSPQYLNAILEIIRLCRIAIQSNKNDGDAHVLLANAYFLAALSCAFQNGYSYFLARAAATIQATRPGNMYIKDREIADKMYGGIVDQLSTQMPEWLESVERLPKDMNKLQSIYYDAAISSSPLDEMKSLLSGMTENRTSIVLTWDANGRISHSISGVALPSPRDDPELWVLAPSALFYLCHQLGVLEPSNGLLVCQQIFDVLSDKHVLTPINKTLRSGRIDLVYRDDGGLTVQFYPNHPLMHNSSDLEEGMRQLVANYFHYIYRRFTEYNKIAIRTITCMIIGSYFIFLDQGIEAGVIGPKEARWNREFSRWSAATVQMVSEKYYVPNVEDREWASKQTKHLDDVMANLFSRHKHLCVQLDLV